jgi:hypothetical protein
LIERLDGAHAPQLTQLVEKYSKQADVAVKEPPVAMDIQARLRHLTTMAPVVLFMKGTFPLF